MDRIIRSILILWLSLSPAVCFSDGVEFLTANSEYISTGVEINQPSTAITLAAWVANRDAGSPGNSDVINLSYTVSSSCTSPFISYNLRYTGTSGEERPGCLMGISGSLEGTTATDRGWTAGDLHHIACTWTSGEPIRIYVDGVEVTATANVSGTIDYSGEDTLNIGFNDCDNVYLDARVLDASVYSVQFSARQIKQLYEGKQRFMALQEGVQLYMPLDELENGTEANITHLDYSPNRANGTGQNTPLGWAAKVLNF